jgi:hypothetical protein
MLNKPKDSSEAVPSVGDARFLKHYPEELRESMLAAKQEFISFLLGLQSMKQKDYALLAVHEKNSKAYRYLYDEWYFSSGLFTEKELRYAPKLRTPEFLRVLRPMVVPLFADQFVITTIAFYAVK